MNALEKTLQRYASHPGKSRGRVYPEAAPKTRDEFQRDRDRIIHTGAFRRLQYKTQVFVTHEGDYFRTRLTHTLEVAQIARSIARALGVNEDLAEALALAHDLGHTPFGHAGEWALQDLLKDHGGFDHNIQTFRILTSLEKRYAGFDGLNLTWETLEGVLKHNGPMTDPLPAFVQTYLKFYDLEVKTFASLEAQIAALSDDIAYTSHDIEDGLKAQLLNMDDLKSLPLIGECLNNALSLSDSKSVIVHTFIRDLIGKLVCDLIETTQKNLDGLSPSSVEDIRRAHKSTAGFSNATSSDLKVIKDFLAKQMYSHFQIMRMKRKAQAIIKDLFQAFSNDWELLPPDLHAVIQKDESSAPLVIADYIASMTDRYAVQEHARLFNPLTRNDDFTYGTYF